MLEIICDIIILIAAVLVAITNIYKFFTGAGRGVQQRIEQAREDNERELNEQIDNRLKAILPDILKEHDLETRQKYLSDRQRYLCEIKDDVVAAMREKLNTIEIHDTQMATFNEVLKELLRERIMLIYGRNKLRRQLEEHEKIELDRAYPLYKAIGGNSYIDDYYARMGTWKVIPDDGQN